MTFIHGLPKLDSMASLIVSGRGMNSRKLPPQGFTLIELLVVLTIVALLLTIAAPQFLPNVKRARESVLKEDLVTMRDAIDKYYADKGAFPTDLGDLVTAKYLTRIPVDPITESDATWVPALLEQSDSKEIVDLHSGAAGKARDGSPFSSW